MKYLKQYESIIDDLPQVGDYVMCYEDDMIYKMTIFLATNIGKIIGICDHKNRTSEYYVHYTEIPNNLKKYFRFKYSGTRVMKRQEILYHAKNIEDLKMIITQNKFNL